MRKAYQLISQRVPLLVSKSLFCFRTWVPPSHSGYSCFYCTRLTAVSVWRCPESKVFSTHVLLTEPDGIAQGTYWLSFIARIPVPIRWS